MLISSLVFFAHVARWAPRALHCGGMPFVAERILAHLSSVTAPPSGETAAVHGFN